MKKILGRIHRHREQPSKTSSAESLVDGAASIPRSSSRTSLSSDSSEDSVKRPFDSPNTSPEKCTSSKTSPDQLIEELLRSIKQNKDEAELESLFSTIRGRSDRTALNECFRDKHGFKALVEPLRSPHETVRRASLRFVGDLITKGGKLENVSNCESLYDGGLLPTIVERLDDTEDIQMMAAGAIRIFAGWESAGLIKHTISFKTEIRKLGGVKAVAYLLRSSNQEMVLQSTSAICHLASNDRESQDILIEEGSLEILIGHLKNQTEDRRQLKILTALLSLISGNEASIRNFLELKGIPAISQFLNSMAYQLQEKTLEIFMNLSMLPDGSFNYDAQTELRESGMLTRSIGLLSSQKESTVKMAGKSIYAMITFNPESQRLAQTQELFKKNQKSIVKSVTSDRRKTRDSFSGYAPTSSA
eukprot:TRINITY_DN536_c0_g1_i1.p1 TRINITY_DN536_c0_g1~~TRINITY_DN536_c0_g1_i1.p1  ORF type:complete len:418 (-),score=72.24 TRINITY_DN536_c0_g1_i1:145-1398(-)